MIGSQLEASPNHDPPRLATTVQGSIWVNRAPWGFQFELLWVTIQTQGVTCPHVVVEGFSLHQASASPQASWRSRISPTRVTRRANRIPDQIRQSALRSELRSQEFGDLCGIQCRTLTEIVTAHEQVQRIRIIDGLADAPDVCRICTNHIDWRREL